MAKVSVIVPVYKVEKWLHRCVESLCNQTLKDLEIILVDDGSPDRSGELCDDWAKKDQRIVVLHKPNGGLSSARNAGLAVATGEYVGFVDSDDDVLPAMYEHMLHVALVNQADCVMCDYQRVPQQGESRIVKKTLSKGLYTRKAIERTIFPQLIMTEQVDYGPLLSVWQCLYRRKFLVENGLKFAEDVKWSEDNLFNSLAGYCMQRFYYMDGAYYRYYENAGTITTSYRPGAWEEYSRMNVYLAEFFEGKTECDFYRQLQLHMLYYACCVLGMECHQGQSINEVVKRLKPILQDSRLMGYMKDFALPEVNLKLKIQLFLVKHRLALPLAYILRR